MILLFLLLACGTGEVCDAPDPATRNDIREAFDDCGRSEADGVTFAACLSSTDDEYYEEAGWCLRRDDCDRMRWCIMAMHSMYCPNRG